MSTVPVLAPTIANNDGWVCCSAMQILTSVFSGAKPGQLGEGVVGALAPSLFVALGKVVDPEAISVSKNSLWTNGDLVLPRKDAAFLRHSFAKIPINSLAGQIPQMEAVVCRKLVRSWNDC